MDTMDYKEKFEKLIQRIDDLIANGWIDEKAGKAILKDFTVESEDERIRKDNLDCIKYMKPNFCHHVVDFSDCSEEYIKAYYDGWNNCNQQHAQLEAEQKPVIEGTFVNVDEVRENFVKEVYRVLANDTTNDRANDIIYYFDSLPTIYLHTNKPLPSDGDDFDMDDILKNHDWSEKDEEHLNSVFERLEGMCKKGATFTQTRFAVSEDEDWLKSLKQRMKGE